MPFAEVLDQALCRGVTGGLVELAGETLINALAKVLAQFDAPLIKGVNAPDGALDEDLVLVQRDQRTEVERVDAVEREDIARAVTGDHLVRCQTLHFGLVQTLGAQLGFGFLAGKGYIDGASAEALAGAVATIAVAVWSVTSKTPAE